MRSIRLDAWEFESSCSEEALELDISRRVAGQYASLAEFALEFGLTWESDQTPMPLSSLRQCAMVCAHLRDACTAGSGGGGAIPSLAGSSSGMERGAFVDKHRRILSALPMVYHCLD